MADVDLVLGSGGPFTPQSPTDLTLRLGPPPGGEFSPFEITVAATLRIGAALAAAAVATVAVNATLRLTASLAATSPIQVGVGATMRLTAALTVGYDPGIPDYLARITSPSWRDGAGVLSGGSILWSQGLRRSAEYDARWRDALRRSAEYDARWRDALARSTEAARLSWRDGALRLVGSGPLSWRGGAHMGADPGRIAWRDGAHMGADPGRIAWRDADALRNSRALAWSDGPRRAHTGQLPWREASAARPDVRLLWRDGAFIETHGGWPFPPAITPPVFVPPVDLRFCQVWVPKNPLALPLSLGIDPCGGNTSGATTWIPIRRIYMTVHTIEAYRLPDMLPIDLFGADISADDGSFGWTLSAAGPLALIDQLAPTGGAPAHIQITLDGLPFVFVVEGLRRSRAFGQTSANISGRSLTALVGEPYMPQASWLNGGTAFAQQLAIGALALTGVALDWRITDWLVPAGAWSYTGTPLAAVQRIAEAAGAVVQSARAAAELRVLPRYPTLPWEWAATTPDVQFPSAVVVREGWERRDRPAYNGVYVAGQTQGVLGFVKRTGTAGDVQPAMVTDALITHADAARQRGSAILGAAGAQASVSIELPVLTGPGEPGIIDVGKLVHVSDGADQWRGLVRSVSVRAARPSLRQTLVLERHL